MEVRNNNREENLFGEFQRNVNKYLMEVSQRVTQANTIQDVASLKDTRAWLQARDQLVEQLHDKLSRSMLAEQLPNGNAKEEVSVLDISRVEDLLWFKIYYEPLARIKKMKKPQHWNHTEALAVRQFIKEGIDFYIGLIENLPHGTCTEDAPVGQALTRCLLRLGDLSRYYCIDLPPCATSALRYSTAGLYYMQVLELRPNFGLAHSNLAAVLLHVDRKRCLAVMHYLAALLSKTHPQARLLLKPVLDTSVRQYEALLDNQDLLVLNGRATAHSTFQHTLLAVVSCFVQRDYDPHHLQIVCRNFLIHFDKILTEQCTGPITVPAGGDSDSDSLAMQASALLVATYHLQRDGRGKTCSVLLASVLLTLLSYLTRSCQRGLSAVYTHAQLAALALPPIPKAPDASSCSDASPGQASGSSAAPTERSKRTRRATRRRRRMRRRPSSEDDSSCEEDGVESDWSRSCSEDCSQGLCSSSDDDSEDDDSGPDAIVESDSENPASAGAASKAPSKDSNRGKFSSVSSEEDPTSSTSAVEHLLLLAKLDAVDGEVLGQQRSSMNPSNSRTNSPEYDQETDTDAVQTSAPGLLSSASLVCTWLQSASISLGAIAWCVDTNSAQPLNGSVIPNTSEANSARTNGEIRSSSPKYPKSENFDSARVNDTVHGGIKDSGVKVAGVNGAVPDTRRTKNGADQELRIMWEALATFCNLVSVDLKQLCAEDNSQHLPNLTPFLKTVKAKEAYTIDGWSDFDNFVLPEDDLHSMLPGVAAEHVRKRRPRALCGHLLKSLERLGIEQREYLSLPDLVKSSHLKRVLTGSPSTKAQIGDVSAHVTRATSKLLPQPRLNVAEMTLLRSLRLRKTVFHLSHFPECPLEFDSRTRAFYMVPDNAAIQRAAFYNQSNNHTNVENEDPEGFYYVKGRVMNEILKNKYREQNPRRRRPERTPRLRPKPDFKSDPKAGKKYRPRRQRHRDQYSYYNEPNKSPEDKEVEQLTATLEVRTNNRSQAGVGGKSYGASRKRDRQDRTDQEASRLTVSKVNNLKSQYPYGHMEGKTSPSVSSDDRKTNPMAQTFLENTVGASRNSPSLSSDDRAAYPSGSQTQRSSKEDKRMGRGTPSSSDDQKNSPRNPDLSTHKKHGSSLASSTTQEEEKTRKRQADQQLLTERWLRHELSAPKKGAATSREYLYIVPDAIALSYYRTALTDLLKQENTVVVPLQVLAHLDDLKRRMGASRDASRWLEYQLRRTGPGGRLKLQASDERRRVPGVQYPGRHCKMPWRWYQILECCHYLANLKYGPEPNRVGGSLYSDRMEASTSRPGTPRHTSRSEDEDTQEHYCIGKKPVVMLLTGETKETVGKLPFSLNSLVAKIGTELRFAGDLQKNLPPPPRRHRT